MKIDISKANLLEKDIEEWLFENPEVLTAPYYTNPITSWIGRQYALPSGIADLIGVRENGMLVVVEVKNVAINKAAVLQVCRYQDDLKHIVSERMDYPYTTDHSEPIIEMILVGPSIDGQTFTEARAVNVEVFQFDVSLSLNVNGMRWTREHRDAVREQHAQIASRPEWEIYGMTNGQDYEQHRAEEAIRESEYGVAPNAAQDEYDALMDAVTSNDTDSDEGESF
jgi:hypothetical protein